MFDTVYLNDIDEILERLILTRLLALNWKYSDMFIYIYIYI